MLFILLCNDIAVRRSTGGQVLGRVFNIGGILDSGIGNLLSPITGQKREDCKKDRKRFLHKVRFYTENEFKKKTGHSSDYILQNIIRD